MSRFTKFALLTLAAFLVLGFSIAVSAKPPFVDKVQQITSAAVNTYGYSCSVVNVSDRTIDDLVLVLIDGEFGTPLSSPYTPTLDPGISGGIGSSTDGRMVYCTISWTGNYGEIRGTFCSYDASSDPRTRVCLDLY